MIEKRMLVRLSVMERRMLVRLSFGTLRLGSVGCRCYPLNKYHLWLVTHNNEFGLLVFESLTSWKTTYGSRNLPPCRENSLQKGIVLRRTQCISAHSDNMPADRCYL